jgi:hypothetical protein
MKRLLSIFVFAALVLPTTVSAQADLQNGAQSLQPQQQAGQQTGTVQEQSTISQAPNNATIFSENQLPALGVVSSPNQTKPDVTVPATQTTAAINNPEGDSNTARWIFGGLLLFAVVLGIVLARRSPAEAVATIPTAPPKKTPPAPKKTASKEVTTEAPKPKAKKKKKPKKKHHR